jgi:hypothetical protein
LGRWGLRFCMFQNKEMRTIFGSRNRIKTNNLIKRKTIVIFNGKHYFRKIITGLKKWYAKLEKCIEHAVLS